jgi:hypothetical protein
MQKFLINYIDFTNEKGFHEFNGWVDTSEFSEKKTVLASISKSVVFDESDNIFSNEDAIEFFYTNYPKNLAILTVEKFKSQYGLPSFETTI